MKPLKSNKPKLIGNTINAGRLYEVKCNFCHKLIQVYERALFGNGSKKCPFCKEYNTVESFERPLGMKEPSGKDKHLTFSDKLKKLEIKRRELARHKNTGRPRTT